MRAVDQGDFSGRGGVDAHEGVAVPVLRPDLSRLIVQLFGRSHAGGPRHAAFLTGHIVEDELNRLVDDNIVFRGVLKHLMRLFSKDKQVDILNL